jgi:site-specific recombinase XerD
MNSKLQATLDYYLIKLATEQLSNSTKRSYASIARQFFYFIEDTGALNGDLAVGSFVPLAQKFLSSERDGKASSITSRASAIKYFLNASGSPCDTFERPRTRLTIRESLTEAELDAFMEAARTFQPRDRAIGMLFATTGIRLLECAALNLENLDTVGDSGTLVLSLKRSCGRQQIPLNAETQATLEEYLRENEDQRIASGQNTNQPLFIDKSGERLSSRALTACVRKIGWSAKLAVTPVTLRVTRLIQLARRGSDAVALAHLGGFDSLESARRIIRACRDDLTRASVEADICRCTFPAQVRK